LLASWFACAAHGSAQPLRLAAQSASGFSAYGPGASAHSAAAMSWLSLTVKIGYGYVSSGSLGNPAYNASIAATLDRLAAYASDGALTADELAALPTVVRARFPQDLSAETLSTIVDRLRRGTQNGACTSIVRVCTTPERRGLYLGFAFHLGGDGFGWDAEPYFVVGASAFAAGLYTGPKFDFQVSDSYYIGFGFGGKLAYVSADGWKYGADIYGRVPVHMTYYQSAHVALELEGAFGYGLSGYATDPKNYLIMSAPEFKFGRAYSWDLTFGVRF
jgi:hypothetical protein